MAAKKDAVLYMLQYLYENTDDDHSVTNEDIQKFLKTMDIELNERSIKPNIDSINECFATAPYIEVQTYRENGKNKYRLTNRPLEVTETEMLVSALNTVRSFSKNDVKNLKTKLYSLLSRHQFEEMLPALSQKDTGGSSGKSIAWNMDVINKAITEGTRVVVSYASSGEIKERHISPYKVHSTADGIYVLGKCNEHDADISIFRLDRIMKISQDSERAVPCKNPQQLYDMINISKDMSYGEKGTAVLVFTKNVENVVFDRYGKDVKVYELPDGRFRISVDEYLSNTLLGWIFSLGNDIEVQGNQTLVKMMKQRVEELSKRL